MMAPHQTLRFCDIRAQHKQSFRTHYASGKLLLTYNARGALFQLLRSLPKTTRDTVLLPAFHCLALVEPVVRAGYRAAFYRIRPDFSIDLEDLKAKCSSRDALIVAVHFFGFPTNVAPVIEVARANGSYVVEDCAHSFLSRDGDRHVGHRGDFALFSYYKLAPSLAGGALGIEATEYPLCDPLASIPLREGLVICKRLIEEMAVNSPHQLFSKVFLAFERKFRSARALAASNNVNPAFSDFVDDPYLFREDLARAEMPRSCRFVLELSDWENIARTRQQNYRAWSDSLGEHPARRRVLPKAPDWVVPWGFPVFLENRIKHEQALRRRGVPLFTFGEILHPALATASDRTRAEAKEISSQLLLLPVHPQIATADIEKCAKVLRSYLDNIGAQSPAASSEEHYRDSRTVTVTGYDQA
jgi:perosamine synthetase